MREINEIRTFDNSEDRLFAELLFNLAAGKRVKERCSYDEQLRYYQQLLHLDNVSDAEIIRYGDRYRMNSRYMFPGRPDQIRNRKVLIALFASYVALKEIYEQEATASCIRLSDLIAAIVARYSMQDDDRQLLEQELRHWQYVERMDQETIESFKYLMAEVQPTYDDVCNSIIAFVTGSPAANKMGTIEAVLAAYKVSEADSDRFRLVVDAIAETTMVKSQCLSYIEEFKNVWEERCLQYAYCEELEEYIKQRKTYYIVSYGNKMNLLRNETALFTILADATVKVALAEGARNLDALTQRVKDMTQELSDKVLRGFLDARKRVIQSYHLNVGGNYIEETCSALIPYRKDLVYIRDLVMEEIRFRNAGNIVQKQPRSGRSFDEEYYKNLIQQKNEEIHELQEDLKYYEDIKRDQFKSEVSQYDRALMDLFRKLCDIKLNAPLNELYLVATGVKQATPDHVKAIVQNMLFVMSTMNIQPYDTSRVGKRVKFEDDEANILYAVDENTVAAGINEAIQIYPGWKYKDTELVLPRVEVEEA